MKKLINFILFFTLSIILCFSSACDKNISTSTTNQEQAIKRPDDTSIESIAIELPPPQYPVIELIEACRLGDLEEVKKLILQDADVNIKDWANFTPVLVASGFDNQEAVKFLLDNGADINAKDIKGNTALMWAIKCGNAGIV